MRYFIFALLLLISPYILSGQKYHPKVGVVLSGGGAKGYTHIEILDAIEKAGIKVDYIAGTSMGAIIGGLYASGYSPEELRVFAKSVDLSSLLIQEKERDQIPFFDKSYKEKYLLNIPFGEKFKVTLPSAISRGQGPLLLLTDMLKHVHEVDDYSKLPIPFFCIATNLETGKEEILDHGFLPMSIMASGAYPSLLQPVKYNNMLLVDGGVVNNYPAKELKNRGMDIIIGVDLDTDLLKEEDLKNAINIIMQIIAFRIKEHNEYERKFVTLNIKPDIKGISVTDFDKVNEILEIGKKAAEENYISLKEIAKLQGYDTVYRPRRENFPSNENLFINSINIIGNKIYDKSYIKRILDIKPPENLSINKINKGVKALFATDNFNNVYYKIENNPDYQTLNIYVNEKKNPNALKFGLHYDDIFKASLLANITFNRVITKNSSVFLDVVFSDNFRTNFNFYIDNENKPSVGYNASFLSFNLDNKVLSKTDLLKNNFSLFTQQLYIQSTLNEKYAVGLGGEFIYNSFKRPLNNSITYPIDNFDNSYYLSPYFYIKADTQDNANFPMNGFKFNSNLKYLMLSNTNNFEQGITVTGKLSYSFPLIKNKFSFTGQASSGLSFNRLPFSQKYFLGGYFEQKINNFSPFLGLPFAYTQGDQFIFLQASLNFRFFKNHYLKVYGNFANVSQEIEDLKYLNYKYSSYGFGYGYDSPFGPIHLNYSYSPNTSKGIFSVSLGYWF